MKPENVFVGEWYQIKVTAKVSPSICGRPVRVTEIKEWGIFGNVPFPLQSGVTELPVSLNWDDIEEREKRD